MTPVGTEKVGDFEYVVSLNGSPTRIDELNDLPIRVVNGTTDLHSRRRLRRMPALRRRSTWFGSTARTPP